MHLPNSHHFPYGLIQVAGVHDLNEAELLLNAGVDMIGLPLRLTVNEEDLSEESAAKLSRALPGKCCLITYLNELSEITEFTRELGVEYVQLHGDVDPGIMPELVRLLPDVRFIKSLIIGKGDLCELRTIAEQFSPYIWSFITDTYNPETGAEGATGMTHDWDASRELIACARRPVILAGGLNPSNVAQAICSVKPAGVDVHTGVEGPDGKKDSHLVTAFVASSKAAFQATSV
jgi:phosphoribosylanthranilate isomerase